LKLDIEAVRVAVSLRLSLDLCVPHECHCGSSVDALGVHSFVCKRAPGKTYRHHAFNDLIARGFPSAGFLSLKSLWVCSDQTASGRMASHLSSGQAVKRWDVTVTCPLADSYINVAAREPGATAELAASVKEEKYADLNGRYTFEPIAIETLGVFNTSARQLLCDFGRKISENTGEVRETSFLF